MGKHWVLVVVLAFAGCASTISEFRVDGSSAESTRRGIETINRKLDEKGRFAFALALLKIQFSETGSAHEVMADPSMLGTNYRFIGKKIDGMSHVEILALAEKSPIKIEVN